MKKWIYLTGYYIRQKSDELFSDTGVREQE